MIRIINRICLASVCLVTAVFAANDARICTEIEYGENCTHVASIEEGRVVVVAGSTQSFTVDTPDDQGLVATDSTVEDITSQICSLGGSKQEYRIVDRMGDQKLHGTLVNGNQLIVSCGAVSKTFPILIRKAALSGRLRLQPEEIAADTERDIVLEFTAGQRSPRASIQITFPRGIDVSEDNITVNVIGRGDVKLRDLPNQSIGRTGTHYPYSRVGTFQIMPAPNGGTILSLEDLDLRPANGPDVRLVVSGVRLLREASLVFQAVYATSEPEILTSSGTGMERATLRVVDKISDFKKVLAKDSPFFESADTWTTAQFQWTPRLTGDEVRLMQSLDRGQSWAASSGVVDSIKGTAEISGLQPNELYTFRLASTEDGKPSYSNSTSFYSGKVDVKTLGATGSGTGDDTEAINAAITYLNELGGGTLLFSEGVYPVRTVHLKSNVYLYLERDATLKALKNGDAPETKWFSGRKYRSGTSPTDAGPYHDPENWLTKQDVGHTYFRNSMFVAERADNIKIVGRGRISGDGNLVTTDGVMKKDSDGRCDKMFSFKLCTNIEIGGLYRMEDLWYDPDNDAPYYIQKDGSRDFTCENMLHIDQGGHFVLLATGTDKINVHDTYFAKHESSNARDIYDFMECNDVTVTNIFSKVSSDDIVKLGSDCALGFTRPAKHFLVRNVIGDTNCNLFQIGSETADDISDVHVDNIYVLGANKAGFSISTNDGAHVRDVHLNCGHTGVIHSRSKMLRTKTPFFISISNRGRVLGSVAKKYSFRENGKLREELLCTNVNIGSVTNVLLNAVDVNELYAGSSYGDRTQRWRAYNGSQKRATPIIAGYALPQRDAVDKELDFALPNGEHTGYIEQIEFKDIHVLAKGGNPSKDRDKHPPELGVGKYNVSDLGVQPAYGLWVRHAKNLLIDGCSFDCETVDGRFAIFLEDVLGARLVRLRLPTHPARAEQVGLKDSCHIDLDSVVGLED